MAWSSNNTNSYKKCNTAHLRRPSSPSSPTFARQTSSAPTGERPPPLPPPAARPLRRPHRLRRRLYSTRDRLYHRRIHRHQSPIEMTLRVVIALMLCKTSTQTHQHCTTCTDNIQLNAIPSKEVTRINDENFSSEVTEKPFRKCPMRSTGWVLTSFWWLETASSQIPSIEPKDCLQNGCRRLSSKKDADGFPPQYPNASPQNGCRRLPSRTCRRLLHLIDVQGFPLE